MEKLTFKQYLDSREQLLKAIDNDPITILEYEIRKYCTIPIGESNDNKQIISLKPKNKIIIEWSYLDPTNPIPTNIQFDGIDSDEINRTFWSSDKLTKWLSRHARDGKEVGYN